MEDERTRVSWGCWLECGISEGAKDPPLTHQAWFTAADLDSYNRGTPLSARLRCGPVATQKQQAGNLIEKIRELVQTHGLYFIHKRRQMARLEMRNFWFVVLLIWEAFFHVKEKDRNLAGSLYEGGQLISSVLILDGWGDEQKTKYKLIAFPPRLLHCQVWYLCTRKVEINVNGVQTPQNRKIKY